MKHSAWIAVACCAASLSSAFALTVPVVEDTSTTPAGLANVITPAAGAATTLVVNGKQSALLRFDLTNLDVVPAAITPANLKSALLRLYAVSANPAADVTVHAITSEWSESVSGKPAPAPVIDAMVLAAIPAADLRGKRFVSVDLTSSVAAALKAGAIFGFAVQTADAKARIAFASKEGPAIGDAAELDLDADLSGGGAAGASLTLSGNLTLPATTATAGVLYAGAAPLLHDYGFGDFFGGLGAGNFTMTGNQNTAVGYQSLALNTGGSYNAALGYQALHANAGGIFNTAAGYLALAANTSGYSNTATGAGALEANTAGSQNSAGGDDALAANTTGNNNTASGYASLYLNQTGSNNSAFGNAALYNNTASNNTAAGYNALFSNTTGTNNLAAGCQALYTNQSGSSNTASGVDALFSNSSGNLNTATGLNALFANSNGYENTADGAGALSANSSGYDNSASGFHALNKNTTGTTNTAVGAYALSSNVTGSFNIAVGEAAGATVTGNNNICIGNPGDGADGVIWIGDQNQTAVFFAGIYGSASGTVGVPVYVAPNGKLYTAGSSQRFKESIRPMDASSEALLQLHPETFRYKAGNGPADEPQYGLIAEEVAAVCPHLIARDAQGAIYTVRYDAVNAMLLNEFLKEHLRVKEQGAQLVRQQQAISTLETRLAALEARMNAPSAAKSPLAAAGAAAAIASKSVPRPVDSSFPQGDVRPKD